MTVVWLIFTLFIVIPGICRMVVNAWRWWFGGGE